MAAKQGGFSSCILSGKTEELKDICNNADPKSLTRVVIYRVNNSSSFSGVNSTLQMSV